MRLWKNGLKCPRALRHLLMTLYRGTVCFQCTEGNKAKELRMGELNEWGENIITLFRHMGWRRARAITSQKYWVKEEFFKIIYLFLERGERKEKERERNINMWLPLMSPPLGTWTATQACDPLVHRLALNPLSHTSQAALYFLWSHKPFSLSVVLYLTLSS